MKHTKLITIFASVLFVLLAVGQAVGSGVDYKAGYVNSRALLAAHPVYSELVVIEERMGTDFSTLDDQIRELLSKQRGGLLSGSEEELLNVSIMTINSLSATYEADVDVLLQRALPDINRAIAEAAEQAGFLMVFDFYAAHEAGIIAYADPSLDLTEDALAKLEAILNPN